MHQPPRENGPCACARMRGGRPEPAGSGGVWDFEFIGDTNEQVIGLIGKQLLGVNPLDINSGCWLIYVDAISLQVSIDFSVAHPVLQCAADAINQPKAF